MRKIINWFRVFFGLATKDQIAIEQIAETCEPIAIKISKPYLYIDSTRVCRRASTDFTSPTQQSEIVENQIVHTFNNGDTITYPVPKSTACPN